MTNIELEITFKEYQFSRVKLVGNQAVVNVQGWETQSPCVRKVSDEVWKLAVMAWKQK